MTSVYEIKKFGRSTADSCRRNVFISCMKAKQLKQEILNQWESIGFPKVNSWKVPWNWITFSQNLVISPD